MTGDVLPWVGLISWCVTGVGLALFLMSWFGKGDPIRKQRLSDCGMALIFAAVLTRVIINPDRTALDWVLGAVSPIFILAAIWRLSRTQPSGDVE